MFACSVVQGYIIYGPVCHLIFFVSVLLCFRINTSPARGAVGDATFHPGYPSFPRLTSRHADGPREVFEQECSLVLAPVFPSISTRARLAILSFLWLVCRRAFPPPPPPNPRYAAGSRAFSAPPCHTGGTRQVFDGWLFPCCRVCFSCNCFYSRVPGSIPRQLEVWEWALRSRIFDSWSSS